MNAQSLYHLLPTFLQHAAVSARGLGIASTRFNRLHRSALATMRARQWASADEWRELQRSRLLALLESASRYVPYYRSVLPPSRPDAALEDLLSSLPLLSKDDLRRDTGRFVSERAHKHRLVSFKTSGTSGAPLTILANVEAMVIGWSAMARFWSWAGVTRGDRRMSFTGNAVVPFGNTAPPFGRYDIPNRRRLMSVYHLGSGTADRYLDEIESFRPVFLDGYPSAIEYCARRAIETGRRIHIAACFPTAETLSDQARETIERGFNTRVYNQYGSQEGAALITECAAGSLHVHPEVGIVEVLREDGTPCEAGEEGELVLTGLNNHVMPFIRYRIGDTAIATASNIPCSCGRYMPTVHAISGRKDDVVITPDGRRVGMLSFNVFKWTENVAISQIVQDDVHHLTVRVVPTPDFGPANREQILTALRDRVGDEIALNIEMCTEIPRGSNGKIQAVVSRIKHTAVTAP